MSDLANQHSGTNPIQASSSTSGVRRTRSGCLTCRQRRVKCDEGKPHCENCLRRNETCVWDTEGERPAKRASRRPNSSSCEECRAKKLRCIDSENNCCERCRKLGISCIRLIRATQRPDRPANSATPIPHGWAGPSTEPIEVQGTVPTGAELQRLVQLYFASVHNFGYFAYVHRLHFERLLKQGRAPSDLLLIMIASAKRFAEDPTLSNLAQADRWADMAISSVLKTVYQGFGAVQLMVLLLAQHYELNRGNFTSAWLLGANCTRMMQMMSLHIYERVYPSRFPPQLSISPLLSPESLRRLAWATFYIDTFVDGGRYGFHIVDEHAYRLQLPSDETAFLADEDVITAGLFNPDNLGYSGETEDKQLGMSAYLLRTASARRQALFLAFRASHNEGTVERLLLEMDEQRRQADILTASLPKRFHFTSVNVALHNDRLATFVLLHILRHNLYIVLDRAALAIYPRDVLQMGKIPQTRRNRIARALPVAGIVQEGLKAGIAFDPQTGVQAYVALEILLLESRRLAEFDPSVDPKSPEIMQALSQLLAVIREIAPRSMFAQQLHIEAVHRLLRNDCAELLDASDLAAFQSEYRLVAQDTAEYDFRDFRWAKLERIRRGARTSTNPANNEALLEYRVGQQTAGPSAAPSRVTSPGLDALDVTRELQTTLTAGEPDLLVPMSEPVNLPSQPWWEPTATDSADRAFSYDLSWLLADTQPSITEDDLLDTSQFWSMTPS